jgi:hypothetical protein
MPSHLESKKVKDDLELEWLLCLASTLESSKWMHSTVEGVAPQRRELPSSKNQKLFESVLKKAFNLSRKQL